MRKSIYILIILLGVFISSKAQLATGKWRTHFAYNSVTKIAHTDNKVFAVSDGALFSVDKLDGGLEFYSKISGLHDSNIATIEYEPNSKQLLIVYANGNIDVMRSGGIVNIPDLYNKQMSASKKVNHILFNGDFAYLSTSFGILVVNMRKHEIADTYIIGPNGTEVVVNNISIHNNKIYASGTNGIYMADITNPNLVNYQFWTLTTDLPGSGTIQNTFTFNGNLFLTRGNKIFQQAEDGSWTAYQSQLTASNAWVSNNQLIVFNGSTSLQIIDSENTIKNINNIGSIRDAHYDIQSQTFWLAAVASGVISYRLQASQTPELSFFKPAGPAVNIPWDMTFAGEKLFVVPGGRWSAQYNRIGDVMIYEKGIWKNITNSSITTKTGYKARDFINVAVNPVDDKHFFVSSYGNGLYEFRNDEFFKWHNTDNSTIENVVPSIPKDYMRLDGAIFDANNNLFVANMGTTSAIKILQNNGTWTQLNYTDANKPTFGRILINQLNPNQKWIPSVRFTPGIFIFDDNGTLNDQSDDKSVFYSFFIDSDPDRNGASISPTNYHCLVQDKNGVIWAGTNDGPLLFYNTNRVFEPGYTASKVKIPRNDGTGEADYLLNETVIKAIAVDGANRKWIGTETSGVLLMSENGQETLRHFTTTNSPLLSNNILSIAINPVTGEVFFGTSQGIVSYQSDAAEAGETFGEVYAYPNPVRQNYNGIITITGLVTNTRVKITDIKGNLVYETTSNGSIATWDGKNIHGRKVNTGIYLAICVTEDGSQNTITKIMVIN